MTIANKILSIIPFTFTFSSYAQNKETQELELMRYSLWFDIVGNFLKTDQEIDSKDAEKSGYLLQIDSQLSFMNDYSFSYISFGWFQGQVQGGRINLENSSGEYEKVLVGTRALYFGLQPNFRYKTIFIGPALQSFFGEDTGFGTMQDKNNANFYGGFTFGTLFIQKDWDLKIYGQALWDLTVRDRRIFYIGGGFSIGFPIGQIREKTIVKEKKVLEYRDRIEVKTEKIIEKVEIVKFLLSSELVNFETAKSTLTQESKSFIIALGKYLAQNPNLWGKLNIDGHTDKRGSQETNLKLSQERAFSVLQTLKEQGVPSSKLIAKGWGSSKPIDSKDDPVALARNRRVELNFEEVTDPATFVKNLTEIKNQHLRPKTCGSQGCK